MDSLLRLSQHPPVVIDPKSSVLSAVELMSKNRVGAIGVVDGEKLIGIFTERDVMERVVLRRLDPNSTPVDSVMTSPVESVASNDDPEAALERMVERHIRHLPICDDRSQILGMLSIRNLLQNQLDKANREADALEAFINADGIGG